MRILITGSDGYLGRVLVGRLRDQGHAVMGMSRRPPTTADTVYADLVDRAQVEAALADVDVEALCHLAARTTVRESFEDPLGYYELNVGGTTNVLRALTTRERTKPLRVVFISTSAVYGSGHPGLLSEDLEPRAENPYAASKSTAEHLVGYLARNGSIDAMTLRCFNIAGSHAGVVDANPTRIIFNALNSAAGHAPHVVISGDGSATREFTHVLDVADAVAAAIDRVRSGQHEVLNVGTGEGISMNDVIAAAEKVIGRHIDVVRRPAAAETHAMVSDSRRIRDRLGWEPVHSGIDDIIGSVWQAMGRPAPQTFPC